VSVHADALGLVVELDLPEFRRRQGQLSPPFLFVVVVVAEDQAIAGELNLRARALLPKVIAFTKGLLRRPIPELGR
jgi:hypothetical protein